MHSPAADIARRLAEEAEFVCRHYLSNGRKQGRYWIVGDVRNTPGRNLYVRLSRPISVPGAAGKWTDSATGQHGDLLDLIALNLGIATLKDMLDEARRFLSLPRKDRHHAPNRPANRGSPEAARPLGPSASRFQARWPIDISRNAASWGSGISTPSNFTRGAITGARNTGVGTHPTPGLLCSPR